MSISKNILVYIRCDFHGGTGAPGVFMTLTLSLYLLLCRYGTNYDQHYK